MSSSSCAELKIRDLEELIKTAESEGNDAEASRLGELLNQAEDDLDEVLGATVERMGEEESDMEDGEGFEDGDDEDDEHDDYVESGDEEGEEEAEVAGGRLVNGAAGRRPLPKDNDDGVLFAAPFFFQAVVPL